MFPLTLGAAAETLREQRSVTLAGAQETWRLVWVGGTGTVCGPEDIDLAATCPCSGWAYAEFGNLVLVRFRGGHEIERMDLRPLFNQGDDGAPDDKAKGSAYLQRWPPQLSDISRADRGDASLVAQIKRRPPPSVMKLADYVHDGTSAAFLIQVGTEPCGKHQYVAVGITKAVPHLHALTSASHPERPLIMPHAAWQALLTNPGPTAVETWACWYHSSDVRNEIVVSARKRRDPSQITAIFLPLCRRGLAFAQRHRTVSESAPVKYWPERKRVLF